ncbi:Uncharacterized protein dnm_033730 [Desulfonema magnum]|uniref:Uncharacterized protein n=1 Tax=Desulfonema magnum TaxID=45655 RepID=A0A975GMV5_9BACT|nr:Uncharacterized protein dnm_033730 [Desulfonema magnum]
MSFLRSQKSVFPLKAQFMTTGSSSCSKKAYSKMAQYFSILLEVL